MKEKKKYFLEVQVKLKDFTCFDLLVGGEKENGE
jgi:hypothetical protein